MMRKIHVRNFRSLRDTEIELGPVNVLVGPNMAGKTNMIHLFRFLVAMVAPRPGTFGLPNAVQSLGGFSEILWKGDSNTFISFDLEGDFWDREGTWRYMLSIVGDQWGTARVQEESLNVFSRSGIQSLIETTQGRREIRDSKGDTISKVEQSTRSALEFEIPDWEGIYYRNMFAGTRFYDLVPRVMRSSNQTISASFLNELGENLSSWLMTLQTLHRSSFDRIDSAMRDAFPGFESLFTVPTQQSTVSIASREKYLNRPITIGQMSDGELCFVALLSLVFGPPELGAPLYCFEDIENHMHPRLLEVLFEVFRQVRGELKSTELSQVIVTTHSPFVIDKCKLEELIVVEKKDGGTVCSRPDSDTHLRKLVSRKEMGLGELYFSGALRNAER